MDQAPIPPGRALEESGVSPPHMTFYPANSKAARENWPGHTWVRREWTKGWRERAKDVAEHPFLLI